MAFELMKKVDRPTIVEYDDYRVVKSGSHYVFNYAYQINNAHGQPIYKHIVLTQNLETFKDEEPIRVFDRDTKLYKLETLIEKEDDEKCFKNIFRQDIIAENCSVDFLTRVKKTVLQNGCKGIINFLGDIILYTEKDILSSIGYKIGYLNPELDDFIRKFINV